jgi:hypothetical protein
LHRYREYDGYSQLYACCYGWRKSVDDLRGAKQRTDCHRRRRLCLEQRRQYGFYYGEPNHDNYLYRYGDQYDDRLHGYCQRDSHRQPAAGGHGNSQSIDDLRGSEQFADSRRRRNLRLDNRPNHGIHYCKSYYINYLYGHGYQLIHRLHGYCERDRYGQSAPRGHGRRQSIDDLRGANQRPDCHRRRNVCLEQRGHDCFYHGKSFHDNYLYGHGN